MMALDVPIGLLQTTTDGCSEHVVNIQSYMYGILKYDSYISLCLNFLCNMGYYDKKEPVISIITK